MLRETGLKAAIKPYFSMISNWVKRFSKSKEPIFFCMTSRVKINRPEPVAYLASTVLTVNASVSILTLVNKSRLGSWSSTRL